MLRNTVIDFYLYWQNSSNITLFWYITSQPVVSQFNLPTDFAVSMFTMHTIVYSSHAEYDKNSDIISTKKYTLHM